MQQVTGGPERGGLPGSDRDTPPPKDADENHTHGDMPNPPPPPRGPKRRGGPDQIWPKLGDKGAGIFFCLHAVGGITFLVPHACFLKMLGILWGFQICVQNMKNFLTPDLPHPAPQTWPLGS